MAGHARYTALLDACVLYPILVCDALISVSVAGLFAAKWTTAIEAEWMRSLERDRGRPAGSFERRRDLMRLATPDWEVDAGACARLEPSLRLPDSGDVHVLAAAIAGHADCIVTSNLKDFPAAALAPHGLEAVHPDDFLVAQMDLDELAVLSALKDMRRRMRNPALTAEVFVERFERSGLVATSTRLQRAIQLI